jgi:lipoate-protein ligase A
MAMDEALMARARETGEILLRVYAWSEPTLSLGRHQSARGRYDLAAARARGVAFVRRPTGGRAVLHHREITYSVAAPESALGALRESYGRINRLLVDALRRMGVAAEEARASGPAPRPGVAPCFEEPVAGEITAGGRKLVGSAQWREQGALLQHGSILVDDDQALASALLAEPGPPPPEPATLRALLARAPAAEEFAAALAGSLASLEGVAPVPLEPDHELLSAARALTERYESDAWTWRR